jgi:hypothetical protein
MEAPPPLDYERCLLRVWLCDPQLPCLDREKRRDFARLRIGAASLAILLFEFTLLCHPSLNTGAHAKCWI